MYVLRIDSSEKNFLVSILKRQQTSRGKLLLSKLNSLEDVFGVVMWADDDVRSILEKNGVEPIDANIQGVRRSYYAQHIDDRMVEHGWEILEQAVLHS